MIGDILVKIAQKQKLFLAEEKELALWALQRDKSNKFITSVRDGTGHINASQIDAVSGGFRWQPYGLSSKIKFSATVPSGGLGVDVTFTNSVYDDLGGFTASSTSFNIKKYGWYEIDIFCDWQQNNTGYRRVDLGGTWTGFILDTVHSSLSSPLTFYKGVITRSVFTIPHDPIKITLVQNSGVDLTCTGTIRMQLIDKSPVFTD